ncbi:MAG: hypothetical protein ABFS45_12380 [Pseudomonadota bacterium]
MSKMIFFLPFIMAWVIGCSTNTSTNLPQIAASDDDVQSPHLHLSLAVAPSAILTPELFNEYVIKTRNLPAANSSDESYKNPLMPCSLLAAGVSAVQLNQMWSEIINNTIPIPLGTNILGKYDNDIQSGTLPRDGSHKSADFIARLFVFHSSGIETTSNTIVAGKTQTECIKLLLSNSDTVAKKIMGMKPDDMIFSHSAAASHYSRILVGDDAIHLFSELNWDDILESHYDEVASPIAPCSLLRTFRLSSRLNKAWFTILNGSLYGTVHPSLEKYSIEMSADVPDVNDPRSAEIMATIFASNILWADEVTDELISESTQKECLVEIYQPGGIRMRLMREGKMSPYR